MPLIMMTGYPCSGKTYRSKQLVEYFKTRIAASTDPRIRRLTLHHVNDSELGIDYGVYKEAQTEKAARAAEYSAVKRVLSKDAIVIADGLNYIKGYRYQLFCEAKATHTPSCVVHVGTSTSKCHEVNQLRIDQGSTTNAYEVNVFDNLIFRYEEPNGMVRWDSPMFTVPFEDDTPPCEAIWDAMIDTQGKNKIAKPNKGTVAVPALESDYFYDLDRKTQDIVQRISVWRKDHPDEGDAEIAYEDSVINLPSRPVSLAELQRIRRQFISMNRQLRLPQDRIHVSFIEYINSTTAT